MVDTENTADFQTSEEGSGTDTVGSSQASTGGSGKRLSKQDLIDKVESLQKKYKGERRWLSLILRDLQEEGILTVRGKVWSPQTLRVFISENLKEPKPSPQEAPAAEARERRRKKKDVTLEPVPEPQKTLLLDEHYPSFRKDLKRIQKTYRLSVELLKRVEDKLETDVPRAGEKMPQLIELLFWHYLDRPEQFLWHHKGKKW
jgi:Rad3-related DNA helicase